MLAGEGVRLVISGSREDREAIRDAIRQMAGGATDLTGRTDLRRLAGVLALADLVVSTDTGVMHLAAALGRPVVSLFGPTAPWRTGPYGQENRALRIGAECSPCFQRQCDRPFCLERITPETVYRAVVKTLQETTGAAPAAAE
jgi:ADP-heptose:LPS heptosyltransferase